MQVSLQGEPQQSPCFTYTEQYMLELSNSRLLTADLNNYCLGAVKTTTLRAGSHGIPSLPS